MNKQQIINYIASKLAILIAEHGSADNISLLANMLRDITREDDYVDANRPLSGSGLSGSYSSSIDYPQTLSSSNIQHAMGAISHSVESPRNSR